MEDLLDIWHKFLAIEPEDFSGKISMVRSFLCVQSFLSGGNIFTYERR